MAVTPERLAACAAKGAGAWPEIRLPQERFAAHIDRLGLNDESIEPHAADLFLVAAVLEGDNLALETFDRQLLRPACGSAARIDSSRTFLDEVAQRLRVTLLTGNAPGLRTYSGAARLSDWLRVVGLRAALALKHADRRHVPTDDVALARKGHLEPGADFEAEIVKAHYLEDFRRALEAGFQRLSLRDRTLLRLHFLDGVSVEVIGKMYSLHRVTVARQLAAIRRSLFDDTRAALAKAYSLAPRELRSLYRALEPALHLSLSRLLEHVPSPNGDHRPHLKVRHNDPDTSSQ